jgi:hypothetical protein
MVKDTAPHYRFHFEQELYNYLLSSENYHRISEEALVSISLEHKQQTQFNLLAHGIMLNEFNAPELHQAFIKAIKLLNLEGGDLDVSLYVVSDQSINAGCIFLGKDDYAVYLNAGLVNLLDLEELSFVIGHELGHLKFLHHKIIKDPSTKISPFLTMRLFEHSRYAEISADRCGLLCVNSSIEIAKRVLLKLATGTNLGFINTSNFSADRQIKLINDLINSHKGLINERMTHPHSQIRIFALEHFNKLINKNNLTKKDIAECDGKILEVLSLLNPKLDNNKNNVLIYGCLWVSYSHKNNIENRNAEIEYIKDICDPILVDQILNETSKIANKDKIKIYKKNFTDLLSHDSEMSMAAKSSVLEKISALASVDEYLDKVEHKVLKKISALLKLPDSFLEALLKKLF